VTDLRKKLCLSLIVFLLLYCSIYSLSPQASAKPDLPIRNINTGLEYATIQAAINAEETVDGHTIIVNAGTYHENIVINKSITLIGQSKFNTIIRGQLSQNVIYIKAENVKLAEFTVEESAYGYSGIYLFHSKGCNVTDNVIKNNYYGIHTYNSNNSIVYNNLITNCEYGIRLYNSTSNTLSENTVTNNKNGIHIDISNNNHASKNNITLNMWNGIYLFQSSNNTISDNTITQNSISGIRLNNSTDNTFSNNTVSKNEDGFSIYESAKNNLLYNMVSNNTDGTWLMHSSQTLIQANTISNNTQYGLRLLDSSDNKIFHNNFANNTLKNSEQPSNTSVANLWDNFFEGNYWSDQKGKDTNKDGISDTPYITDQRTWLGIHSKDNYPLMGPFQHLNLQFQNNSYSIDVISNSTITTAQYNYGQKKEEATLTLKSISQQNSSFCRICIPHTLVEPPYAITINNNPPTYNSTINTNGTHTWIYFEYESQENTTTITLSQMITPIPQPPIWTQWSFWELLGLTAFAAVLSLISIKYHRTINKQKNLLRLYEEKLQKANPILIARELFTSDVASRKTKITKFEDKYGLKIRPRNSFEDIIRTIKSKQKEQKESEKSQQKG
jgi:parallel beta-helix repeat protein